MSISIVYNIIQKWLLNFKQNYQAIGSKFCLDFSVHYSVHYRLLEPKEMLNGRTNIFGKEYNIADNTESYSTLSLNDVVEFLGLEDCSVESETIALQQWAISQIPTTTTITTELPTTTENSLTTSYFDIYNQ